VLNLLLFGQFTTPHTTVLISTSEPRQWSLTVF